MKATGIVRRIDDLGRVVIPKEIRRTLRIREGDPLEIYTEKDGEVIFKKYSPIGEIAKYAGEYVDTLVKSTELPIIITDRDAIIAVGGVAKKDLISKMVSRELEKIMSARQVYTYKIENSKKIPASEESEKYSIAVAATIVSGGDIIGSVCALLPESGAVANEADIKLISALSMLLGKQMES